MTRGCCLRRVVLGAAVGCAVAACAAISGLDRLRVDCSSGLCDDGSTAGTSTNDSGDGEGGGVSFTDAYEESSAETVADGDSDGGASGETFSDAPSTLGEGPMGMTGDGSGEGASSIDGAGECAASPSDPDHCGRCDVRCGACGGARVCLNGACAGGTVYFYEPFSDNAQGWTLDPSWSIAPECSSPPAPMMGFPDPTLDHTSSAGDGGVVGAYVCGNTLAGQTSPFRYATSPAIDVSAAPALKLTFYRWLNTDRPAWMLSTVDVFDGSVWQPVYTNANGSSTLATDSAWGKFEYDVTAFKNSVFRVRFGYAVLRVDAYAMSSWNVDDVTVSSGSCP
jgi:hypothetical protein